MRVALSWLAGLMEQGEGAGWRLETPTSFDSQI
jgi:hypothetical protein